MKKILPLLLVASGAYSQTSVYVPSSGPAIQAVVGGTNASPVVLQTQFAHGFSNSCNTTTNPCYCAPAGVPQGAGASYVNGPHLCVPTDTTHLAIYNLDGTATSSSGDWWFGASVIPGASYPAAMQWVRAMTQYTIPANPGPLGFFDGSSGDLVRRLSLSTFTGLTSTNGVVVSGCSGGANCVVTVHVTYNPTTFGKFPVAVGNHFSITGTGTSLDTCGDGTESAGAQSPYTVASVTSSSWTSAPFTCAGLANADYTSINSVCGPASTPNDTIGGSQSCTRVSFLATTANPWWTKLLFFMNQNHLVTSPNYKCIFDGGQNYPGGLMAFLSQAAIRFAVDPTNSLWLQEMVYAANNDFRSGGVGYPANSNAWVGQSNSVYDYSTDQIGLGLIYSWLAHAPEGRYWTSSEQTAFLNRNFNDIDDPTVTPATTTNQDAANKSTHNWVLSSGMLASGTNDSTHAQLPSGDPHYSTTNYYVNTVIALQNSGVDYSNQTYGLITAQSNTGVLTVSSWQRQGNQSGGMTPDLKEIAAATYTSGLTGITGTTGQFVCLNFGGNAFGIVALSGTNTITGGASITITNPGSSVSSAPTTASVQTTCSTASASGTANVSVTLGTPYTIFDTITTSSTAAGSSATITFTKTTSLSGSINAGDGIMGYNGWGQNFYISQYMSYVPTGATIGSGTITGVINSNGVTVSTSTPTMAWRIPQWTTGDAGRLWVSKQQQNRSQGVQPILYGNGAQASFYSYNGIYVFPTTGANGGGDDPNGWADFELATAMDDSRAVRDLTRTLAYSTDMGALGPQMASSTGRLGDGPSYGSDEDAPYAERLVWALQQTLPSYPALDGAWLQNMTTFYMFEQLPQLYVGNTYMAGWADDGYGHALVCGSCDTIGLSAFAPILLWDPSSQAALYFRNWQNSVGGSSLYAQSEGIDGSTAFLHNDPRVVDTCAGTPATCYTAQPLQYFFDTSSSSLATSLTGINYGFINDVFISRTCWQCAAGTEAMFDSSTWRYDFYDAQRVGNFSLWKGGAALLCNDSNPCNTFASSDPSNTADVLQIGAAGTNQFQIGLAGAIGNTPFLWEAGRANGQYGDPNSNYIGACSSIAPNYSASFLLSTYSVTIGHANECVLHFKKSGHLESFLRLDDYALSTGTTSLQWHVHMPTTQNVYGGYTNTVSYLGSNKFEELEDGNSGRTYGLLGWITSPGTITVNDDGTSYSGGNGVTHRLTVAGGSSVGAAVSSLVSVTCFKVMQSLTDTTFNTTALNPDANWTGAQCADGNSTNIGLVARNGVTHSVITPFTASFSGPGDWMILGLTPGKYAVSVGGAPVAGSPFIVGVGDSSIYFNTSGGGQLSVLQTNTTSMSGSVKISGNTVIH